MCVFLLWYPGSNLFNLPVVPKHCIATIIADSMIFIPSEFYSWRNEWFEFSVDDVVNWSWVGENYAIWRITNIDPVAILVAMPLLVLVLVLNFYLLKISMILVYVSSLLHR